MINALNVLLIIFWFIIVPLGLGLFAVPLFNHGAANECGLVACFPFGFAIMIFVFQLLALPAVYFQLPFHTLKNQWAVAVIVLLLFSIFINWKKAILLIKEYKNIKLEKCTRLILGLLMVIVLFQTWLLVFHMHVDTDDVRFISEAMEAYELDTMLMHHPITGEYLGRALGEMTKELSSPYPFFIAVMAKMIMLPPAVTAHVVFPLALIPLFYVQAHIIGRFFFDDNKDVAVFLLILSIIILFSFESIYALGYTLLTIIWQGRSILATIMLPLLWYILMEGMHREIKTRHAAFIVIVSLACCSLSGMGIISSICLMASYVVAYAVSLKNYKRAFLLLMMVLPALLNLGYYFIGYKLYGYRL